MSKKIPPIFIVGSARSGTTLLYSIILSSGKFPIYEAESLLLSVCKYKYGNLKKESNYKRFLNDWFRSKQFIRSGLSKDFFINLSSEIRSNYVIFLKEFKEKMAELQGKSSWIEQTPDNIYHIKEIIKIIPDAKFIHIIRDGRDVALSKRKMGWVTTKSNDPVKQLIAAGVSWEKAVKTGKKCKSFLKNNYLEIYFERLIQNTEHELDRLSRFIDVDITIDDIKRSSIGALEKMNSAFDENKKGIQKDVVYRWKKMLTSHELLMFNTAFKDLLLENGYEVDNTFPYFSKYYFQAFGYKLYYSFLIEIKSMLKKYFLFGRFLPTELELQL